MDDHAADMLVAAEAGGARAQRLREVDEHARGRPPQEGVGLREGGAPLAQQRERGAPGFVRREGAALDVVGLSFERYIGAPTPEAHVHRHRSWVALSPVQRDGAAVVRSLRAT